MNDEDAFQAHLDAHPDDHTARLVFADLLEERGDPRAEGIRALGVLCLIPERDGRHHDWHCNPRRSQFVRQMPPDWILLIPGSRRVLYAGASTRDSRKGPKSRRTVEDAAALAFARLPDARRAELLGLVEVGG